MEEKDTMRIVLLGKTGAGKSSLANTIFGKKGKFKESDSPNSETKKCQTETRKIKGRNIKLIDTPGLFDTDPRCSELSPEILKCMEESAPGPHAFLIVLKVERYTEQEQAVVEIILKCFSEEALKYTTVVFTHGEQLEKGKTIKEWVSENEDLTNLVQKCGGRCHVIDNKHWGKKQDKYRNNKKQVKELLKTIDKTVKENGNVCYTNEMLGQRSAEPDKSSCSTVMTFDWHSKLSEIITVVPVGVMLSVLLGTGTGMILALVKSGKAHMLLSGVRKGATAGVTALSRAWEWASARWDAPNDAVKEITSFMGELEVLFKQVKKTSEAGGEPLSNLCRVQ